MKANASKTTHVDENDLVLTRIIGAPRERVFSAWTDPAQVAQWWGPRGTTTPICEIDLRPGGVFRTVMQSSDGTEYPNSGVYLEIVEPERLIFTDAFDEGFRPTLDSFLTAIITFEDQDGKTQLTCRARHKSKADRDKHEQMGFQKGWDEMLERLEEHLSSPDGS